MSIASSVLVTGFQASLATHGIELSLDGSPAVKFVALVDDLSPQSLDFEIDNESRSFSEVHIANGTAGLEQVTYGSVLLEVDGTRSHRVVNRVTGRIKTTFRCLIQE